MKQPEIVQTLLFLFGQPRFFFQDGLTQKALEDVQCGLNSKVGQISDFAISSGIGDCLLAGIFMLKAPPTCPKGLGPYLFVQTAHEINGRCLFSGHFYCGMTFAQIV